MNHSLEVKQAAMCERKEQERKQERKPYSHRRTTAAKLQEIINTATDPMVVIEAANAQAKFLPKPKQARRRKGTLVGKPTIKKEPTLEDMVAALDKKRRGQPLNEAEKQMVSAVENKPIESAEVAPQKGCC